MGGAHKIEYNLYYRIKRYSFEVFKAFAAAYTLAKHSSAAGIFHTCHCSGPTVGVQTLTFSLWFLYGH